MDDAARSPTVWIRAEDADHPKLERLRRAVDVQIGPEKGTARPWLVWGNGLSRGWLIEKLDAGSQVLIFPPWSDGGFAGLPAVRTVESPPGALLLEGQSYAVGAMIGLEPTPAWQEHGVFAGSKVAWLVAHEPFVGAGRAWLCTAEVLVASPSTRPKEARRLTADLAEYLTRFCRQRTPVRTEPADEQQPGITGFSRQDAPYLLAVLGLPGPADAERTAQFVHRRLGVEPDLQAIGRVLEHPDVKADLLQPIGGRSQIAKVVDDLGLRSYRLEIEETVL